MGAASPADRDVLSWPELEFRLRQRPGWRRIGREWHGPCAVSGDGKDTCWFRPGSRTAVVAGCRRCGGRLTPEAFRAHLEAVVGDVATRPLGPASRAVPPEAADPLPGRVWEASEPVAADSPAFAYLSRDRRVVVSCASLPPSVRWLPLAASVGVRCRPALPAGSAGALLYRFAGPGEAETRAVQVEALAADGRRLLCRVGRGSVSVKRASVAGSAFGNGRRVFQACAGEPDRGCWLVEGPLDALAMLRLAALGLVDLGGAAVFGVAGAPAGFTARACWARGPVRVAPDGDRAGVEAATRLCIELCLAGRPHRVHRAPAHLDWAAFAREGDLEREGLRDH